MLSSRLSECRAAAACELSLVATRGDGMFRLGAFCCKVFGLVRVTGFRGGPPRAVLPESARLSDEGRSLYVPLTGGDCGLDVTLSEL